MKLPLFKPVTKPSEWFDCLDRLQVEPSLAIDLEANSMFAYRESVCLIQISTPTQDYIVDPTADLDLTGLGELVTDPTIEKIFHAAEYDLILLKRQYGWELNNLFDTMWAARILAYQRFGLASLLEQFYDIRLNKRYQKSNWCKRPLDPEQLAYAQHDTHFLFQLRDRLARELSEMGCEEEAAEVFAAQTQIRLNDNSFNPDSFWSMNGARDLTRQQQAILKALNIFRDQEARRRDQPLFKIFNERMQDFMGTYNEMISPKDARVKLKLAVFHFLSWMQDNPSWTRVYIKDIATNPRFFLSDEHLVKLRHDEKLLGIYSQGEDQGVFRTMNADIFLALFFGPIYFTSLPWALLNQGGSLIAELDDLFDFLFRAVSSRKATPVPDSPLPV